MPSSSVLGTTDYVIIGLMLAVSACVGFYFRFTGGKQKTTSEHLMANRNMSVGPVAFSLVATDLSSTAILGIPAETYMHGTQLLMSAVIMPFCSFIAAYTIVPVFFNMDFSTAYEYLEKRFGKTTRSVASAFFILQMIAVMSVGMYAPAVALNAITGISMWTSVITLGAVCMFYCALGGLKAVLWTDAFQAILMYVTVFAVVIGAAIHLGSLGELFRVAKKGGRLILFNMSPNPTERYTFWNTIATGIIFSFYNYSSSQTTVQRLLSVGNLKKAQRAVFCSMPLMSIFAAFCFLDGIAIYSMYHDCDPMQRPGKKLDSPDQLIPYAILNMFGSIPGLSGLCIAGIFSASLSTVSSALNSVTVVVIEDFIRPFCICKRLTESWMAFLAKILAIAFGILCLLLIYIVENFQGVLEASYTLSGMTRGPMLGIYILGMFTMAANEPGMLIGLIAGFAINAWMGFGGIYAAKIRSPTLSRSTAGCASVANVTSYFTTSPGDTTLFELESVADKLSLTGGEEKYVFPLYRVSFLLLPVISSAIVILVGYVASRIIGIWKKYPVVDPNCLSPFVRKWFSRGSQVLSSEKDPQKAQIHRKASEKIHMAERKSKSSEVTYLDNGCATTATSET